MGEAAVCQGEVMGDERDGVHHEQSEQHVGMNGLQQKEGRNQYLLRHQDVQVHACTYLVIETGAYIMYDAD